MLEFKNEVEATEVMDEAVSYMDRFVADVEKIDVWEWQRFRENELTSAVNEYKTWLNNWIKDVVLPEPLETESSGYLF